MQVAGDGGDAADMRGRRRIQADLKKLEQEARFLEVHLLPRSPLFSLPLP
jgi:guanine nucleotide-binding protein subunit gamma 1/2, plant